MQEKVEQLGYQAELIDFKQDNSLSRYEMLKLRIKRMPVYIKERKKYRALADSREKIKEKNELFEQFYKTYLHVGKKKYTTTQQLMENPPVYDGYVVGSDQTWNPFVANSPEAFFLPFVENKSKKGSYGPSLAVKSLSDEKEKEYRKKLSNFSFLSCREQDGAQLLSRITQKEVKCVLDPTLLLSAKEWGKYCEFEIPKEPYILVYFLGEKSEHRRAVEKIQKLTNWKIISLPAAYLEMENNDYKKVWGGPKEFLSLIRGAALICTDSFHGTMFSINFQRNFFSFCKSSDSEESSENSRLYSALNIFGLSNRIIHNMDNLTAEDISIDYKNVIPILEEQRRDKELNAYTIDNYERLIYEYHICKARKVPFVIYTHYWQLNTDEKAKKLIKQIYNYVIKDGAEIVPLSECFK